MQNELKKLRRKYIITSFSIVFAIIVVMMFVLNIFMYFSYVNETDMVSDVIMQTAKNNTDSFNTEYFDLTKAETDSNGNIMIPRNIKDINGITMNGTITCKNTSANWFNAGGGILFDVNTENGTQLVHKEYVFNKNTTNIYLDMTDYSNLLVNGTPVKATKEDVLNDYFVISPVWWTGSSDVYTTNDPNVNLTLESIKITYTEPIASFDSSSDIITHSNFSELFNGSIPNVLNSVTAFYFVTDSNNSLISVNDGNLYSALSNDTANKYIAKILAKNNKSGKITIDNSDYRFNTEVKENFNIISFVSCDSSDSAMDRLVIISVIITVIVLAIIFILIWYISKKVIKPVADSFEKQKQFISNAGHALKTPITVISTTIDIINRQKGEDKWTQCIQNQSAKMQTLVCELLDLSRISEYEQAKSGFKQANISKICECCVSSFEIKCFEIGKTLKFCIDDDILLLCDESKISQLTDILIDNALKYSDENSTIEFSLKKEKSKTIMTCKNICKDFDISDMSMLFERFYRNDNDKSSEQEGFGLGLSIAKAIADLHNAEIKGSCDNNTVSFQVIF